MHDVRVGGGDVKDMKVCASRIPLLHSSFGVEISGRERAGGFFARGGEVSNYCWVVWPNGGVALNHENLRRGVRRAEHRGTPALLSGV